LVWCGNKPKAARSRRNAGDHEEYFKAEDSDHNDPAEGEEEIVEDRMYDVQDEA
jgi:hypothetical protein